MRWKRACSKAFSPLIFSNESNFKHAYVNRTQRRHRLSNSMNDRQRHSGRGRVFSEESRLRASSMPSSSPTPKAYSSDAERLGMLTDESELAAQVHQKDPLGPQLPYPPMSRASIHDSFLGQSWSTQQPVSSDRVRRRLGLLSLIKSLRCSWIKEQGRSARVDVQIC